jgi:hypothetical protein
MRSFSLYAALDAGTPSAPRRYLLVLAIGGAGVDWPVEPAWLRPSLGESWPTLSSPYRCLRPLCSPSLLVAHTCRRRLRKAHEAAGPSGRSGLRCSKAWKRRTRHACSPASRCCVRGRRCSFAPFIPAGERVSRPPFVTITESTQITSTSGADQAAVPLRRGQAAALTRLRRAKSSRPLATGRQCGAAAALTRRRRPQQFWSSDCERRAGGAVPVAASAAHMQRACGQGAGRAAAVRRTAPAGPCGCSGAARRAGAGAGAGDVLRPLENPMPFFTNWGRDFLRCGARDACLAGCLSTGRSGAGRRAGLRQCGRSGWAASRPRWNGPGQGAGGCARPGMR